ncbi:MAG: SET domain-containing protein [Brumimicrobium sp.]|nr:SET domain-containing protein [Brumimicrobium sp.]
MIHSNTELRFVNDLVGYGVFATELIPEGTIVYVKDSLEIVVKPEDLKKHNKEIQDVIEKYSYIDPKGDRIISWDFAKFVNHCCNYNTISTGYGFEIAVKDIQKGEQITDEYGIFNLTEEMEITCGYQNCRKKIKPDDFDKYYPEWDEVIKRSMKKFNQVEQPLLPFVDENTKKELNAYLEDPKQYKSVYALRLKKMKQES